jgi:ribose 5-phosphate isomerase A
VGLGSGKAALAFVRALGARIRDQRLKVTGVPTSLLTEQVAREVGIPLATLEETESIDITVDGADEVDPYLNLTKGGGGNLTREKVVASITKKFVIVVGEEKLAPRLGTYFPVFVEVIEFAKPVVTRKLVSMGAKVTPRLNEDGSPYLHCLFTNGKPNNHELRDPYALDLALHHIPGVVETGLFINMANEVIVAHVDGTVEHKS